MYMIATKKNINNTLVHRVSIAFAHPPIPVSIVSS